MHSRDPFADGFRLLERFGGRFREGWPFDAAEGEAADGLEPCADVFEDREGLHLEIELPGVSASDVNVIRTADAIIVEADRRPVGGREVRRLEGRYGQMRRRFELPLRAQPERAMAELRLGVLRIFVPLVAAAKIDARLEVGAREGGAEIAIEDCG